MEIQFPTWVDGPTPCKTRTFSVFVKRRPHGGTLVVMTTRQPRRSRAEEEVPYGYEEKF